MPDRRPDEPLDHHEQTVLSEATAPNRSPGEDVEEQVEDIANGEDLPLKQADDRADRKR